MVALVRSWQDLAKILASIPMHLGKRAKIRVTGCGWKKRVLDDNFLLYMWEMFEAVFLTDVVRMTDKRDIYIWQTNAYFVKFANLFT